MEPHQIAMSRVETLLVDNRLRSFIDDELLPGSGVDPDVFWPGFDTLINDFGPRNLALLERRAELQSNIDQWLGHHSCDDSTYVDFLCEIGYLTPSGDAVSIDNGVVDPEISTIAGPQLVVPVLNARYALNAANARWGSLYDALYGTDALGDLPPAGPYDSSRGARVVAWVKSFLDGVVPLAQGSHADAVAYRVVDGQLIIDTRTGAGGLAQPDKWVGYLGDPELPSAVLLRNHNLTIELVIDRRDDIGGTDAAGVADVRLESAVTAIMDAEDSVVAVDAVDKIAVYRNWLGLMRGDLTADFIKAGSASTRSLAADRTFTAADGTPHTVRSRALMLVRNVGLLTTTPAVIDAAGNEAFEGLLDAAITVVAAMHDLFRPDGARNSRSGAVYVVKPKLHGPDECAFVDAMFDHVEGMLGLPPRTVKIGLMDEERRTSVNLRECVRALRHRLAFINTGFLDRTGDEIHTSMCAGPVVRKAEMKEQRWYAAYELSNVEVGLACGLGGRAQIGKGMWAAPNLMAGMLEQKLSHPRAGANCAWVPSPTAATLHATHYHRVDVLATQQWLADQPAEDRLSDLLTVPLATTEYSEADRQAELDNNAQGILGYVVRWVDQGIGCSTVPDIHDIALMEDRATCRISSQHIANWLVHGLLSPGQVDEAFRRMAVVVDRQNADDPNYRPMAPRFDGPAFQAAIDLALRGAEQPNGYTEPILHARRLDRKSRHFVE
jgi:malate synthase